MGSYLCCGEAASQQQLASQRPRGALTARPGIQRAPSEKATRLTIEGLSGDLLGIDETQSSEDSYINGMFNPEDTLNFRVRVSGVKLHRASSSLVTAKDCYRRIEREGPDSSDKLRRGP